MATVEISTIETMALKKLALINGVLAGSFKDKTAGRETKALLSVLIEVINRASQPSDASVQS